MLCTSTIGDSAVTVSVSSSEPTCRSSIERDNDGAGDLDAVAPDGVEALQREGDGVGAGPEIDDAVLAGAVGRRRCGLSR